MVEHDLAKVGVASSNLVSRSKFSFSRTNLYAGIAQLVEHVPRHEVIANLRQVVMTTNYLLSHTPSKYAGIAQLVEHDLAKVGVASSNLVSRSKMAEWQNGYAADCKSVDLGSTPGSASIICCSRNSRVQPVPVLATTQCPGGEIGRHKGFKIPRW